MGNQGQPPKLKIEDISDIRRYMDMKSQVGVWIFCMKFCWFYPINGLGLYLTQMTAGYCGGGMLGGRLDDPGTLAAAFCFNIVQSNV